MFKIVTYLSNVPTISLQYNVSILRILQSLYSTMSMDACSSQNARPMNAASSSRICEDAAKRGYARSLAAQVPVRKYFKYVNAM